MTPLRLFRAAAIAEAVTWALLIAGMLQKYVFRAGDWGVSIGGALHGFVFLAFVVIVVVVAINQRWSAGRAIVALASAVVPFASIPAEVRFVRAGALDGGWRTETSDDPRDGSLADRLLRWWLRRPRLLAVVAGVVVVAAFAALLVVGPPGRDAA
ncbi:DUF3817 domain-containing protein [Herbiconiux sp. L3-i23]|uniref:DUF3817 domain-containing protein n=1 Tax=Herbiconiux sp. L3-i23 TaxID=2905871 RepID=UPI0020700C14|nr:DUF3817 domain-containing protein [Herbiconiux sp. L3-i23]BDI22886.1 hypothetical protein L3i23_16620 [Herbiconiux sp. L3-i23]